MIPVQIVEVDVDEQVLTQSFAYDALDRLTGAPASTVVGALALGLGAAFDLGAATEGFLNVFVGYPVTGRFDSGDILDMAGLVPVMGLVTDLGSVASNLTGWRIDVTP